MGWRGNLPKYPGISSEAGPEAAFAGGRWCRQAKSRGEETAGLSGLFSPLFLVGGGAHDLFARGAARRAAPSVDAVEPPGGSNPIHRFGVRFHG